MFSSQGILNKLGYGRGAMVKGVQRGIATISTSEVTKDITINAVVTANSVVRCYIRGNLTAYFNSRFPVSELINSTTVRLRISQLPFDTVYVIWEVVEYYAGVIKSKQTGTLAAGTITTTNGYALTVSSVDMAKSELIAEHTAVSNDTLSPPNEACSADLESATTIRFRHGTNDAWTFNGIYNWQLIEFY